MMSQITLCVIALLLGTDLIKLQCEVKSVIFKRFRRFETLIFIEQIFQRHAETGVRCQRFFKNLLGT